MVLINYEFQVAYEETPIIDALHKFVYKRVSALPIVDKEVTEDICKGTQFHTFLVIILNAFGGLVNFMAFLFCRKSKHSQKLKRKVILPNEG